MKCKTTLLSLIFGVTAMAATPGPQGRNSKFFYFEIVSKEAASFTFKTSSHCKDRKTERIDVKEFISQQEYPSTENGKPTSVRIVNLYVDSFSPCSQGASGVLEKNRSISADPNRMTHVYITVSDGVTVTSH